MIFYLECVIDSAPEVVFTACRNSIRKGHKEHEGYTKDTTSLCSLCDLRVLRDPPLCHFFPSHSK